MDITGNVVIEKGVGVNSRVLSIACPKCGAAKHQICNVSTQQICAERVATLFAKESKPLVAPFGD